MEKEGTREYYQKFVVWCDQLEQLYQSSFFIGWLRLIYVAKIFEALQTKMEIKKANRRKKFGFFVLRKFLMPLMYKTPKNARETAIFAAKRYRNYQSEHFCLFANRQNNLKDHKKSLLYF